MKDLFGLLGIAVGILAWGYVYWSVLQEEKNDE